MRKKIGHFLAALETKLLDINSARFPLARHRYRLASVASRVAWTGCVVALLLSAAIPAAAQIRSATITGTVTDPTGALVPNADVVVTQTSTGVSYPSKTNRDGIYTVPYLAPGDYSVSVTKGGFRAFLEKDVHLDPTQTVKADVKLTVGSTSAVVEVNASSLQLDTQNATLSTTIPAAVIAEIPNPSNDPFGYMNLSSSVSPNSTALSATSINSFGIGLNGRSADAGFGVDGAQGSESDLTLDGLPIMGTGYNEPTIIPNLEGVQSVQLITNNFSAEYGRGAGIAEITTKPGTNQYHGQVNYENRNAFLMANSAANKMQTPVIKRPAFNVNDIGGVVGGPIRKGHIFFNSSFHWLAHNYGSTYLETVPTDLERKGDFGSSVINGANGLPTPVEIFNPFSVTTINSNLYQRAEYPKSTNCGAYGCGDVITNPSAVGLYIMSLYPEPNRTPINPENSENYQADVLNTVRSYTNNNRIDYKRGRNSFYFTGGFDWATIVNPNRFGAGDVKGFNDVGAVTADRNIYGQAGDTIVFSPTLIADLRYGIVRDHTSDLGGVASGFTNYAAFGIAGATQALFAGKGYAPVVNPGSYSNLTPDAQFQNKDAHQLEHSGNFSLTKLKGPWTFKAGAQFSVQLADFQDFEEGAANLGGCCASDVGGYTTEYIQATGASAGGSFNTLPQDNGFGGAQELVNEGVWFVRPGANLRPAYASKYFAFYSENDWKVTPKVTLTLGLRYELQPGVEERYNRAAMYDLTSMNAFGTLGSIAFPGTTNPTSGRKYGHAMWATQLGNLTPHLGATWQILPRLVASGGFAINYFPTNTGYFSSPNDYGEATWASGNTGSLTYGPSPAGIPTEQITDAAPLIAATLNNYDAPQTYGVNEAYFIPNMKNQREAQYNFTLQTTFGAKSQWLLSAAEAGNRQYHLTTRDLPFENIQTLSAHQPALLASWRQTWIDSNGKDQEQTAQVPNPYQPTTGPLLPFQNSLAGRTIQQFIPYLQYPLLYGGASDLDEDIGFGSYDSLQVNLIHRTAALYLNASYTWSKSLIFAQSPVAGGNVGGGNIDLLCNRCNLNYSPTDVPNRFVLSAVYQLPFNKGQPWAPGGRVARETLGGWSLAPVIRFSGGEPIQLGGLSGQFTGHINYAGEGKGSVPLVLPKSYQHWYNGVTKVTLPCGIQVTPGNYTRLKYNECAFGGPTVTTPNGTILADEYWYPNGNSTNGNIRGPSFADFATTVEKNFNITERYQFQFSAAITNLLNMAEWNSGESGGVGGTDVVNNLANGQIPGLAQGSGYGARGDGTYDPRAVELIGKIVF